MDSTHKEHQRFAGGGAGLGSADVEGTSEQVARRRSQVAVASGTNLVAGVWLICAPFVLTYTGTRDALWDDIVVGAIIATFAACRVFGAYRQTWLSQTNAVLGGWLVVAPFVLGYSGVNDAVYNDIIVGLVVLTFGIWSAAATGSRARR